LAVRKQNPRVFAKIFIWTASRKRRNALRKTLFLQRNSTPYKGRRSAQLLCAADQLRSTTASTQKCKISLFHNYALFKAVIGKRSLCHGNPNHPFSRN